MEDPDSDKYVHGVDSDYIQDEPVDDMAWNFHHLHGSDYRAVSLSQVIRKFCQRNNVNEPETLIAAKGISEDRICFNSRAVD